MKTPTPALSFFVPNWEQPLEQPFVSAGIKAGFPSPAADFEEAKISLDRLVVRNKEATFYARANGNSMTGAGIDDGDILVIDRSLPPAHHKIAVCYLDGEFTVKRIRKEGDRVWLMPENPAYPPIAVHEGNELIVWGVVTFVVKAL